MQMDVRDCHAALQATIAAGLIDSDRVVVTGGSHGGFLTGHLVGQYPGLFKAAVMRNPVLNLPLMVHVRVLLFFSSDLEHLTQFHVYRTGAFH